MTMEETPKKIYQHIPSMAIIVLASVLIWYKAIFMGHHLVGGEASRFDGPSMAIQLNAFDEYSHGLWTNMMGGGHPLLAEMQLGLLNPIRYICAAIFEPLLASNLYKWLSLVVGSFGVYFLAIFIGSTRPSSVFCAIAVMFTGAWWWAQHNIAVSGTLAWAPWFMLTTIAWYRKPSYVSASLISLCVFLLLVSGYPQIAHSVIIYMLCYLITKLCFKHERTRIINSSAIYFTSSLFAIILAIGLASAQWIPTVEALKESYRNDGIELLCPSVIDLAAPTLCTSTIETAVNGLFYPPSFEWEDINVSVNSNSLLLLFIFLMIPLVFKKGGSELIAHLVATLLIMNLGMQHASPLFTLLYNYHIIPGLSQFQIMFIFYLVGVIGLGLICSMALTHLSEKTKHSNISDLYLLLVSLFLLWALEQVAPQSLNIYTTSLPILIVIAAIIGSRVWGKPKIIILLACVALILEVFLFEKFKHVTIPNKKYLSSKTGEIISDRANHNQFKFYSASISGIKALFSSINDPVEQDKLTNEFHINSLDPLINYLYKINHHNATISLTNKKAKMLAPLIHNEIMGVTGTPGNRAIDYLGIKYILLDGNRSVSSAGFSKISTSNYGTSVYENTSAKPRIQVYRADNVSFASSLEDALSLLTHNRKTKLVIESDRLQENISPAHTKDIHFKVITDSPQKYAVRIQADSDAWLFISDINYPGWEAYINGERHTVRSAHIMGKAIYVPQGDNMVTVRYTPTSFYVGLTVSLLSFLLFFVLLYRTKKSSSRGIVCHS